MNDKLENLIYFSYILQHQSQFYVLSYGAGNTIVPRNQAQIFSWLKDSEKYTSEEINRHTKALHDEKDYLFRGAMKYWEERRKKNQSDCIVKP